MPRHFVSQADLTSGEMMHVFDRARALKRERYTAHLPGRSLVMFFEKSSTRTRLSFEIGMAQLGGHAVYLDRQSSQLARGESIEDTARIVSRYADLLMARVYAHDTVLRLAEAAAIPVINGLSDEEHPCQSMADFMTILEVLGRVAGVKIAYVGDGDNNVTHSLLLAAGLLGSHITVASPREMRPRQAFVEAARAAAIEHGGSVTLTDDPIEGVSGADVIYTDVWVSMGREADAEQRLEALAAYAVTEDLMKRAGPECIFMHCLPAHIGQEVTAEVAYGPRSVIFEQAENRLHVQKALILHLLESSQGGH